MSKVKENFTVNFNKCRRRQRVLRYFTAESKSMLLRMTAFLCICSLALQIIFASQTSYGADEPDVVREFDGASIFYELGDIRDYFDDEASVSFWLKMNDATPADSSRTGLHHLSGDNSISHYPWPNGLAYINTFRSSRVTEIELSEDIDREQWHMLTITSEPGEGGWRLYQNDELVHETSGDESISLDHISVVGACHINRGPDFFFDGRQGDILMYNRALSQDEVARLFQGEHLSEGLVIHWPELLQDLDKSREFRPGKTVELGPVELRNPEGDVEYQWYLDREPIEGAADRVLTIREMTEGDIGVYYVEINDDREVTPVKSSFIRIARPDWPMWRFDPARTADSPHVISEDLHLQWVRELPEPQRAWPHQWDDRGKLDFDVSYSPVVKGDKIFVPSNVTDSVTAYTIEDGAEVWRFFTDGPVRLAPVVWGGSVYFVSDDGYLYCVDAEGGELNWRYQGGPSEHMLLGNERIISLWAARGAPVVKNGIVYFAAGLWPMHGVFVYALDAESGEVQWVNDTVGTDFVALPHGGAYGYGGLVPQGYLAVSGNRLVVSGGRATPAVFDTETGETDTMDFRAKPAGGYAVNADGMGYRENDVLNARLEAVADRIDGEVFYKLMARNRLFVTTEEGRLYCFGPEETEPNIHEHVQKEIRPWTDEWAGPAEKIADALGKDTGGYALVLGAGSKDLLRELILRTELHMVVVESDGEIVAQLREELSGAGLYGRRSAVIEAELADFKVRPYLFTLLASEDIMSAGIEPEQGRMNALFDLLMPYGGLAWLGFSSGDVSDAALAAEVDGVSVEAENDHVFALREGPLSGAGKWTHQYHDTANTLLSDDELVRMPLGILWFGGPSNHNILPRHSGGPRPQIVGGRQIYLGVETVGARCVYTGRQLWEKEFPGIGHPFTNLELEEEWAEGNEVYMTNIPGATYIGSPFVSLADGIYLRYQGHIYRLDPSTGKTQEVFSVPGRSPQVIYADQNAPDWGHISVKGDHLITTSEPHIFEDEELGWTDSYSGTSSRRLVVLDRHSGEVLWEREASVGFRHNAIISVENTLFIIDGLSENAVDHLVRRGEEPESPSKIFALDLQNGEELWSTDSEVFGTFLLYSKVHDILVEGGSQDLRRTLSDEPGNVVGRDGKTGEKVWESSLLLPAAVKGEMLIPGRPGTAISLLTGDEWMREQPLTGQSSKWSYSRAYGCNTLNASRHLLLYRTGYAGYFDLKYDSGTGNFSGFRSGCTANMIAADGVLNALDYTRTCTCSYPHQTSLAMVHIPEDDSLVEFWTRRDASPPDPSGHGINFGAPGRRVDVAGSGITWHDREGTHRRHPSAVSSGSGIAWVAASAREIKDGDTIRIDDLIDTAYILRLHFAELDEDAGPGRREFDVLIDGEKVLEGFDIVRVTGDRLRSTVEEFIVDVSESEVEIELRRSPDSSLDPIISGIEIMKK